MEIWDGHCHINAYSGTPAERVGKMLEVADRMGVAKLCIYMGTAFYAEPTADQLKLANDEVLEAVATWPDRVYGWVYLSPAHPELSLSELERCVAKGPMVAIKLWVAQNCDTPEADAIVKRAGELKAPVLQHTWHKITGNMAGESNSLDLTRLAARHPDVTFICGHTGGDWELGIRAIRPCKNIYADLAGGDPTSGFTEMAVRELGAERVIYGSDIPGRSFGSQLAKVMGARIGESERELVLAGNLKRILKPIFDSKA
jgi:hypothetical protein